jgi:uroporphyrinogen-III synthase
VRTPLAHHRIVITRAEHQAGGLAEAFAAAGAEVELLPLLEVIPPADPRPLERAASELALYDWLVFTSSNAVEAFLPLTGGGVPDRLRIAVVGPATAEALRAWEIEPHLIASRSEAEGLLADLAPLVDRSRRVLLPQAADARPALAEGLARAGAEAVVVVAYDKGLPADAPRRAVELFSGQPIGWVTFTSPRIVRHFTDLFGADWDRRRPELQAASIGPVTTAELRRHGVEPAAEAERPGEEGLVEAVVRAVAQLNPAAPPSKPPARG